MTFKGATYETLLEIKKLIIANEALLKAYQYEQKTRALQRDTDALAQVEIKINVQKKFIDQLNKLLDDLINDMDLLIYDMNDLEGKVFVSKFMLDKNNQTIMDELAIGQTTLYRNYDSIQNKLNTSPVGKSFLETLKE